MKPVFWEKKLNTKYEQAAITWLAYQFIDSQIICIDNMTTQEFISNMFNVHSDLGVKWKRILLE